MLIGSGAPTQYHRLIWYDNSNAIFVTSKNATLSSSERSLQWCVSGALTNAVRCSNTIVDLQVLSSSSGSFTHWENVYQAQSTTQMNQGGDSGAAWWRNTGNAFDVGGSHSSSTLFVADGNVIYRSRFLSIAEVETELAATVATTGGSSSSW